MALIDTDLDDVRTRLRDAVRGTGASAMPFLEGLVGRPGKLLRPRLLCLSARANFAGGGEAGLPERVLDAAVAVELLHLASLVHDDIIDESPLRRGSPSLYALKGARLAVLAGDWLLSRALALALKAYAGMEAPSSTGKRELRSEALLGASLGRMVEAEIAQSDGRFSLPSGRRPYLRRIHAKTALLFEMACRSGARAVEAAAGAEGALARYGHAFGMAFQITDDLLDFEASAAELGKPSGSDLSSGILTLPVIEALAAPGSESLRRLLARRPWKGRRLKEIRRKVAELGGLARAKSLALLWTERGLRAVDVLPPSPARDGLAELCRGLVSRSA